MNKLLTKPNVTYKYPLKKIKLPSKLSSSLAELIGIHFGDGNIYISNKKSYRISYCFNINDIELVNQVKRTYKILFGLKAYQLIRKNKNCVELYYYSKYLCHFLNQNFSVPITRKENLKIPNIIKSDKIFLKSFIKGLFKTDGCLFIKKDIRKNKTYKYPVIKITTKSKSFARDIKLALIKLNFRANIYYKTRNIQRNKHLVYDIVLHGETQCKKWHETIIKMGAQGFEVQN